MSSLDLSIAAQLEASRIRCVRGSGESAVSDQKLRKALFADYMKKNASHPEVIFFESMSGAKMMDSPFAIFEHLYHSREPEHQRYMYVWSVRSLDSVPLEYKNADNVIFTKRHTRNYLYYLTRAKYIIGNSVFPEYFVRRSDQLYLNTWHGVGFKTLGRSETSPLGAQQAVYNMLQSTHVISPCPFMTDVHEYGFSMKGVHSGEIAEVGYPRIDRTLDRSKTARQSIVDEMKLDAEKKTVLYAPTWRGSEFDVDRLVQDLSNLSKLDANLVFMGHHLMQKYLKEISFSQVFVPPGSMNTNRLLSVVDVVVTDYSSIYFDVLNTGAKIVHYVYDYEEYVQTRGLSLRLEDLPGQVARTSDELVASVSSAVESDSVPDYQFASERFAPYDHGSSTEAVVKWVFAGDPSLVKVVSLSVARPRVIYWGGRLDETESTKEFLQELSTLAEDDDVDVSLFVARSVSSMGNVMETLRSLGSSVSVITRGSYQFAMTEEEERARSELSSDSLPESRSLYADIYRREYRRIFGDSRFDAVVLHPNLSRFWKELSKYAVK